ncbi:hypothetical protein HDU87_008443 [Geranomyces variabilis]|uniref:Uncharacterized protein n=1 Tax=Geranomyces variabilis TaxID=109894 RepID=A0AAD5TEF4_9FUNG|nr:hypothetical protein HDU87_008443 [Geranomyces variabilis]
MTVSPTTAVRTTLLTRSEDFRPALTTTQNLIKALDPKVKRSTPHALTACVIVHPRLPALFDAFLALKRTHGTAVEKAVYDYGIHGWEDLAKRLIRKRPVVFFMRDDRTLLRGGDPSELRSRHADWLKVGTENEAEDLRMQDYLTYDEMALSALLGASTSTLFLNSGGRRNNAVAAPERPHEEEGVYIGLVGARYEVPERMEWAYTIGTRREQDTQLRGMWDNFFGGPCELDGRTLNRDRYKQRIRITLECLFLEAQRRATVARKRAYVVVVGFGLGVWAIDQKQPEWFVEAAMDALRELALPSLGVVDFSYFPPSVASLAPSALDNGPRIKFTKNDPADKLTGEDEGMLLVSSFAWDGNAYVGNEYYLGSLAGSGDPAAVCCSTVGELLNPEINVDFADRLVVL